MVKEAATGAGNPTTVPRRLHLPHGSGRVSQLPQPPHRACRLARQQPPCHPRLPVGCGAPYTNGHCPVPGGGLGSGVRVGPVLHGTVPTASPLPSGAARRAAPRCRPGAEMAGPPPPPRRSCRRGGGARGREGRRGRPTSRQDRSGRFPGGTVSAGAGRATVPQSRPLSAGLADHTSDGSTAAGTAAKSDGMTPPRPSRATTRGGWVAARRPWQSLREGCSMRVYSRIAFRYTLILASTTHPVAYLYSRQMKVGHSLLTFSVSCEYTHE